MMVKLLHLLFMIHLISCASQNIRKESFEQKMRHYQTKAQSNLIPALTVDTRHFQQIQTSSRRPASASPTHSKMKAPSALAPSKKGMGLQRIHFSNKRLYFLSLLEQHEKFQNYLSQPISPPIESCPGLHNAFLDYKRSGQSLRRNTPANIQPTGALLNLPVEHVSQGKLLADIEEQKLRKQLFPKALSVHVEKTYAELVELCHYGSSDNYYAYENLMTHIKRAPQGFLASSKNLQSLIKTTIFSNDILLSTLEKQTSQKNLRAPASLSTKGHFWLNKVIQKHHLQWFEKYIQTIK